MHRKAIHNFRFIAQKLVYKSLSIDVQLPKPLKFISASAVAPVEAVVSGLERNKSIALLSMTATPPLISLTIQDKSIANKSSLHRILLSLHYLASGSNTTGITSHRVCNCSNYQQEHRRRPHGTRNDKFPRALYAVYHFTNSRCHALQPSYRKSLIKRSLPYDIQIFR
jgi:hypothetical protein